MEDGKKAGQKLVVGEAVGMEAEGGGELEDEGEGERKRTRERKTCNDLSPTTAARHRSGNDRGATFTDG